jgi:hypothetical protein
MCPKRNLDAAIRWETWWVENRSKDEVEKSGQQGPQEKNEPEDMPFGKGLYEENSNAMQGGMRGWKKKQESKRKLRKAHCSFTVANQTSVEGTSLASQSPERRLLAADHGNYSPRGRQTFFVYIMITPCARTHCKACDKWIMTHVEE